MHFPNDFAQLVHQLHKHLLFLFTSSINFNHEKTEPKEHMMGEVAMANTYCLDSELIVSHNRLKGSKILLQHPWGIALEADMIFTASCNWLQNFHSSKSTKPQIPQETDSGTAPLKCLSRSATRMVAIVFQDKWAMSTGLGSSSNAGGCQFEQKYPKPTSLQVSVFSFDTKSGCWHSYNNPRRHIFFRISRNTCTPHSHTPFSGRLPPWCQNELADSRHW